MGTTTSAEGTLPCQPNNFSVSPRVVVQGLLFRLAPNWHQDADKADPIQRRSELREHGWGEIIRAGTAKLPTQYKSEFAQQMEKCKATDFDKGQGRPRH